MWLWNNLLKLLTKNELSDYTQLAAEMLEKFEAKDLVAAALRSLTREPNDTPVSISEERPLPSRGNSRGGGGGGYKGNRSGGRPSSGGGGRGYGGGGARRSGGSGGNAPSGSRDGARRDSGVVHVTLNQIVNHELSKNPGSAISAYPDFFVYYKVQRGM